MHWRHFGGPGSGWGGERLAAPHLMDVEVISAWRRMVLAGDLDGRRAELAIVDPGALRVDRVPHGRLLDGAGNFGPTSPATTYVALAELLDAVLLTADKRLLRVTGCRCAIKGLL